MPITATRDQADQRYHDARSYLEQGDLGRALTEIESARALYVAADEPDSALRTDLGRINVLDDLGRHHESAAIGRTMLDEVRRRRLEAPAESHDLLAWLEAAASENYGASLGWLGLHRAAAESLAHAEQVYGQVGSFEDGARVLANLGIEYLEMGDHALALDHLDRALSELRRVGAGHLVARAQNYRAAALALAGQYGLALDALADADKLTTNERPESGSVDELRSRAGRAEVFATLGLWNDASKSADELSREFGRLGLVRDRAQIEIVRSVALRASGNRDAATTAARLSVGLFTDLGLLVRAARATLTLATCVEPDEARTCLRSVLRTFSDAGENWGVAASAIQLAELTNEPDDQRHWISLASDAGVENYPELRWRTSWMLGLSAEDEGRFDQAHAHLVDAVETIRGLRRNVVDDHLRLPFMRGRRDPVEALVGLQLRLGQTADALETTANERSWSLVDHRSGSGMKDARSLARGTLTYQSIGDRLFVFAVDEHEQATVTELSIRIDEVRDLADRLDAQWRRLADPRMRVHLERLRSATDLVLKELYLGLVAPVEGIIDGGPLTIVPTGALASLPFHAFHDGSQYLIQRQQISLSASPFESTQHMKPKQPRRTLVIGVSDKLAPRIRDEVASIGELTDAVMLVGSDATLDVVRSQASRHDVIHFACHSEFDPENPDLSAFRLADGWVRAAELAAWSLRGSTVVMASCSSGRQGDVNVDEFTGLPRSLLSAGTDAVIVNLWPVDDETSVGIMSHFHLAMKTTSPAEALRSAQLAALDLFPHPYLWAPAVTYTAMSSKHHNRRN